MYNLAEFLTSLHMDVVTESSGDLFNVHVVLILEFDHACNTVHGRIQFQANDKESCISFTLEYMYNV
jgi:hypothetical protein